MICSCHFTEIMANIHRDMRSSLYRRTTDKNHTQLPHSVWQMHVIYWLAAEPQSVLYPDSKVYGANMGPIWGVGPIRVLSAPDGPHDGPMNLAESVCLVLKEATRTQTVRKVETLLNERPTGMRPLLRSCMAYQPTYMAAYSQLDIALYYQTQ